MNLMFVFVNIAELTSGFIRTIPGSIGNKVLLTTPIAIVTKRLNRGKGVRGCPLTVITNMNLLVLVDFSSGCRRGEGAGGFLSLITECKGLFPCLVTVMMKLLINRLSTPKLRVNAFVGVPRFGSVVSRIDVFNMKVPPTSVFVGTLPLTLIYCIVTFNSFIAARALMSRTHRTESSRCVSFGSDHSGLMDNLEGLVLSVVTPFPPLSNPL